LKKEVGSPPEDEICYRRSGKLTLGDKTVGSIFNFGRNMMDFEEAPPKGLYP